MKLTKERKSMPSVVYDDPNYKRLYYVRYANDWLLSITGSYVEAKTILARISTFCESIGLRANADKSKITNLHTDQAHFLGSDIKFTRHVGYSSSQNTSINKRKIRPRLMLTAPLLKIREKLTSAGFIKNNRSVPK